MKRVNALVGVLAVAVLGIGLADETRAEIVELSLVVDASGSINNSDFALQIDAYESIFGSGSFYTDFVAAGDTLWVNMILFGNNVVQKIGWTSITNNAAADAFAAAVGLVTRAGVQTFATNTSAATDAAVASILGNGINGDRQIIDVSTDGFPNEPGTSANARAAAVASAAAANGAGITVNAIGVGGGVGATFLNDYTTAGGGFFVQADDFAAFEATLVTKLFRELQPQTVPEPGTLFLLGMGLIGAGLMRRKPTAV